jgi:hypothetical protein
VKGSPIPGLRRQRRSGRERERADATKSPGMDLAKIEALAALPFFKVIEESGSSLTSR